MNKLEAISREILMIKVLVNYKKCIMNCCELPGGCHLTTDGQGGITGGGEAGLGAPTANPSLLP